LVDPFSGEGIGNALVSGRVASESIEAHLKDGASLAGYGAKLREAIDGREIDLHYRLRTLARHARLIDVLVGGAEAHPDVLEWMRSMTAESDTVSRKRALLSPLTYAKLWMRPKKN